MATIIKSSGEEIEVTPKNGVAFNLEELQGFVHGYIQLLYLRDGRPMFCNEDGLRLQLPMNEKATKLYGGGWIVGDIITGTRRELGFNDEENEDLN